MAIFTPTSVTLSTTSSLTFQQLPNFIHNVLINGGWVQTADPQGTVNALTWLGSPNADYIGGYLIYRMNDSLQSTYPVFVRFDYGEYDLYWHTILRLTVGTGTDAYGNITGVLFKTAIMPNLWSSGTSYGSATSSRAVVAICTTAGANYGMWFSIERTKNSLGADNGDGVIVHTGNSNGQIRSRWCPFNMDVTPYHSNLYAVLPGQLTLYNGNYQMGLATP